jgi:hypothetical protein
VTARRDENKSRAFRRVSLRVFRRRKPPAGHAARRNTQDRPDPSNHAKRRPRGGARHASGGPNGGHTRGLRARAGRRERRLHGAGAGARRRRRAALSVRFKIEGGYGAVAIVDPSSVEIVEYALPNVDEEGQPVVRPAIAEPGPKDDVILAAVVTPDDAANSSILKKSGAPAGKRRRVFDDRVNVVPLGPLPTERPAGPSAHEVWFGRASPEN